MASHVGHGRYGMDQGSDVRRIHRGIPEDQTGHAMIRVAMRHSTQPTRRVGVKRIRFLIDQGQGYATGQNRQRTRWCMATAIDTPGRDAGRLTASGANMVFRKHKNIDARS